MGEIKNVTQTVTNPTVLQINDITRETGGENRTEAKCEKQGLTRCYR